MTVAQRVNAERLSLLGWSRAILLQLAHPLIAAGVHDHSGFRATPIAAIARLHHTVGAMLALTFGETSERQRVIDQILAIHRRVNGCLPVDAGPFTAGTRYSAEDPDLVLWVHITLLDSVPMMYEMLVESLTDHERDRYCAEAAAVAIALGAREDAVPMTWEATRASIDGMHNSGTLVVTPQAREVAHALMAPRGAALVAPVAWANHLFTIGSLPASIREQYGWHWRPSDDRALRAMIAGLRASRRLTPRMLALWRQARTLR